MSVRSAWAVFLIWGALCAAGHALMGFPKLTCAVTATPAQFNTGTPPR